MNIKPQPRVETATLSITGVEKRLIEGFRQRCEELNSSAQGFIMNQILGQFLKSTGQKPNAKPRRRGAVA